MISKSHPDNFSIIKAVTQTQFENSVTAFIMEKLSGCDFEIISKLDSYFLMTVLALRFDVNSQNYFKKHL